MTCPQVQLDLSLYLYGELDFAHEEQLEQHLAACAACQLALAREKEWHARSRSVQPDVPLPLLSDCRRDLRVALTAGAPRRFQLPHWHWRGLFGFTSSRWSGQVALASFLVFVGFYAGRLVERFGVPGLSGDNGLNTMSLANSGSSHVREVQPSGKNRVRIILDQVHEREITGSIDNSAVRQLVLAALRDPMDAGLRMDSVAILDNQDGSDVRDALVFAARNDSNAAVRLKALEGLRRFSVDPATHDCLRYVLQHDSDPNVRSEAIDVLAPDGQPHGIGPALADTLLQIANSQQEDDYVRVRCYQILQTLGTSPPVY